MAAVGRRYIVPISAVSVSAAQDLWNFTATANMAIRLVRFELGQITQTTIGTLGLKIVRNPATVTAGSGGSAGTVGRMRGTDAAATFTSRINDTTGQTTSGTQVVVGQRGWELLNGGLWLPTPDEDWSAAISEGLAIQLVNAPGSAITVDGYAEVEEKF